LGDAAVVNRPFDNRGQTLGLTKTLVQNYISISVDSAGASTGFSFLNLDDRTAQLQLTEGTCEFGIGGEPG